MRVQLWLVFIFLFRVVTIVLGLLFLCVFCVIFILVLPITLFHFLISHEI